MHAMSDDETAIRALVERWQNATSSGDVATVLTLMTDDVVFQVPGKMPFGKAEFEAMSAARPGSARPTIDAQQTILELQVQGDLAYMRSALRVRVTPPHGKSTERTGTTLTIFRKVRGHWLLSRDANLLVAA
jgi:uncharacterized protein (TIGR02246 family)